MFSLPLFIAEPNGGVTLSINDRRACAVKGGRRGRTGVGEGGRGGGVKIPLDFVKKRGKVHFCCSALTPQKLLSLTVSSRLVAGFTPQTSRLTPHKVLPFFDTKYFLKKIRIGCHLGSVHHSKEDKDGGACLGDLKRVS